MRVYRKGNLNTVGGNTASVVIINKNLQKTHNRLPNITAVPFLGIHLMDSTSRWNRDTYISITATLFTVTKLRNQPLVLTAYLSIDEEIKKICAYIQQSYPVMKKNKKMCYFL